MADGIRTCELGQEGRDHMMRQEARAQGGPVLQPLATPTSQYAHGKAKVPNT